MTTDSIKRVTLVTRRAVGGLGGSIVRGFEAAGVEVVWLPYPNWFPKFRFPRELGGGLPARFVGTLQRASLERRLRREIVASKPDLVLIVKCDDLTRGFYRQLSRACPAPLAFFHPDDPFNHSRAWRERLRRRHPSHPNAMAQCTAGGHYFTWSRAIAARVKTRFGTEATYLPFAGDPVQHTPVNPTPAEWEQFGADVSFVGTFDPERVPWLEALAGMNVRFALWGEVAWGRVPSLARAYRGRPLYGREMSLAVACSGINVNLLRTQNKDACNMRSFEILTAGGFLLHERSEEFEKLFPVGEAYADFGTPDELAEQVGRYLDDPIARAKIALTGHELVGRYTYQTWAETMMRTVLAAG